MNVVRLGNTVRVVGVNNGTVRSGSLSQAVNQADFEQANRPVLNPLADLKRPVFLAGINENDVDELSEFIYWARDPPVGNYT